MSENEAAAGPAAGAGDHHITKDIHLHQFGYRCHLMSECECSWSGSLSLRRGGPGLVQRELVPG
jgi:hypothetical protein